MKRTRLTPVSDWMPRDFRKKRNPAWRARKRFRREHRSKS